MPRVIHFELNADDPERAAAFYRQVFAWQIDKWEGPAEYWLITTGPESEPGIGGAITRRSGNLTTVNTISVPSVDEAVQKVVVAGGQIALPKMAVPGVGYIAYGIDTEGNVFGMMQEDPTAQDPCS